MPVQTRARSARRGDPAVAERIRRLRGARGLTQAQLAGDDFTKGFISQLESGFSRLSLRAAQVLSARLGLSVADLVGDAKASDQQTELAILRAERELAAGSPAVALKMTDQIRASGRFRGRVLRLRARALLGLDRARDAVVTLEEALTELRAHGLLDLAARVQYDLAYAHARLDGSEEALLAAFECERAFKAGELIDRTLELQLHALIASLQVRRGDVEGADRHIERAVRLAEDVSDREALAAVHASLARIEQDRGNLDRAIEQWRQSLSQLEELGREHAVAETWHNLALTYLARGADPSARAALSRAEELARDLCHDRLRPWIAVARAKLALRSKRYVEAERLAADATRDGAITARCKAEAMLVIAQGMRQRPAPASRVRHAYEEALAAADGQPSASRARILREYADALEGLGDLRGGFERAREALDILRPDGSSRRASARLTADAGVRSRASATH